MIHISSPFPGICATIVDSLALQSYDHVILLCYSDWLDTQEADARTLTTLLHLRAIADGCGRPFTIVSEMLDVRNRNLADVTRADDFIVSEHLVSLILAQIAENKALQVVLGDIFAAESSGIHLKPAGHYVEPGVPMNFYTILEAARRRGEVAFGYRLHALSNDRARSYGVVINPEKSHPVTFADEDRIIVLSGS
jgi:ion channel POLLUX/CASTOR